MNLTNKSKYMSYILRHGAEKEGVPIDKEGWVNVDTLIAKVNDGKESLTVDIIKQIVAEDKKGRYSFNVDGTKIRANQGHSLDTIDIKYKKEVPPVELYHGTAKKNEADIRKKGILKMNRTHVHLSDDIFTATSVGGRHGKPVVLVLDTKKMLADGIEFFKSENGVWLVDHVDPKYIK